MVRLSALLGSGGLSPEVACLAHRRQVQARDAFDLYILWLGGHAKPGCAGSLTLTTAERDQAMETLLGFTYADYAGQVLDCLEPAERERFAGERRWTEIVGRGIWAQPEHQRFTPTAAGPLLLGNEQGYVSFLSAMHLHRLIAQIPGSIQAATTGYARRLDTPVARYEFLRIQPSMMRHGIAASAT